MTIPTLSVAAPIDNNHVLIVTATYEIQNLSSGTDWTGGTYASAIMIQNGIPTFGDEHPFTTTRTPFTIQYAFAPIAGYTITAGLSIYYSVNTVTIWNLKLQAELVKR